MRQHTNWRWRLVEVYVKINGEMRYLWRAVDHEGEVLESFVSQPRPPRAAEALTPLKAAADASGQITPEAAAKLGFVLTYDPGAIEMAIQFPLAARLTRTIALGLGGQNVAKPDRSDPVAAYLNYRAGEQ